MNELITRTDVLRALDMAETLDAARQAIEETPSAVPDDVRYGRLWTAASLRAAGWKCVGQAGGLRWTGKRRPEVDLYPAQLKLRFEIGGLKR